MRTLRATDFSTGGLAVAVGLATIVASRSIRAMAGESLDPRTLPAIVGWTLVACGAGIIYSGWRYRGEPVPVHWPDGSGVRRLAVTAGLLLGYVGLLESLGFPVATAAFVAAHSWYLGGYRPWVTLLGGLATGLVVYYVFMVLLELTLPLGLIESLYG